MKNYIYKLAISKAIFHHLSKYVKWNASKQSSNILNGNNIYLEKYDIHSCEKQITTVLNVFSLYFYQAISIDWLIQSICKMSNKYIKYW